MTLVSLPLELVAAIVKHLPIDKDLRNIALASSRTGFTAVILRNNFYANAHFQFQLKAFNALGPKYQSSDYSKVGSVFRLLPGARYLDHESYPTAYFAICESLEWQDITAASEITEIPMIYREVYLMYMIPFIVKASIRRQRVYLKHLHISNQQLKVVFEKLVVQCVKGKDIARALLRLACSYGLTDCVKYMLRDLDLDPNQQTNNDQMTAIDVAASGGYLDLVELLLADPRVVLDRGGGGWCKSLGPIKCATIGGYYKLVEYLLNDPRAPRIQAGDGLLQIAMDADDYELFKLLLQHTSADDDDDYIDDMWEVLWMAAARGKRLEYVKTLVEDYAIDPSIRSSYVLQVAARNGQTRIAEYLLSDPRVDPSVRDNQPLRQASKYGSVDIVRLLLNDTRVDPSALNNYAVEHAAERGHLDIVRILLHDDRVNPGDNCNSALEKAIENGHLEVVEILSNDSRVTLAPEDVEKIRMFREVKAKIE